MAFGVQRCLSILYHVIAVAVLVPALLRILVFAGIDAVFVAVPPPLVIARSIDVILHVGVFDGLAEKVLCLYVEAGRLTGVDEFLGSGNGDLVFGFLVFLNLEITGRHSIRGASDYSVGSKRRICSDAYLAVEGSARRQRKILLEYLAAVGVFDRDFRGTRANFVPRRSEPSQYAFEVDLLFGPINGPIRVDISRDSIRAALFARFFAFSLAFSSASREIERIKIGDRKVIAVRRQHKEVILADFTRGGVGIDIFIGNLSSTFLGYLDLCSRDTALVGYALPERLFSLGDLDARSFARSAALSIDGVDDDLPAWRSLGDERQIGDDRYRVGPQIFVDALDQIDAGLALAERDHPHVVFVFERRQRLAPRTHHLVGVQERHSRVIRDVERHAITLASKLLIERLARFVM